MLSVVFPNTLKPMTTNIEFIRRKHSKSVFGIDAIPSTDLNWQYAVCCVFSCNELSTQRLQILNLFGVMLPKPVFGIDTIPNTDLNWQYAVCWVLYFHTLSTQWLQILNLFGFAFPKYKKVTSTDLVNKRFEICSWIPLTMVQSLQLNSALLRIKWDKNCSSF